jgi:hypothetical protein
LPFYALLRAQSARRGSGVNVKPIHRALALIYTLGKLGNRNVSQHVANRNRTEKSLSFSKNRIDKCYPEMLAFR